MYMLDFIIDIVSVKSLIRAYISELLFSYFILLLFWAWHNNDL